MTAPVSERMESLDAIRGVAVLGIFMVNILGFGIGETAFFNPILVGGEGALNDGLWSFTYTYINGTMRGLFSLLFGAGIVMFMSKAPYPDGPVGVADLYYRRTFWLILIGLFHSYFLLGPGDILLIYGIAGIFLFPFRVLQPKTLLKLAGAILIILTALIALEELEEKELSDQAAAITEAGVEHVTPEEQEILDRWYEIEDGPWPSAEEIQADVDHRTGDIVTVFLGNAKWVEANSQPDGIFWWVIDGMLMMFIGMAMYKTGVLTAQRDKAFYARLFLIAYAIGLPIRIWSINARWAAEFSPILWLWPILEETARVALTVGHVGLFFLLWNALKESALMKALAATGRMALSNYLGQTVIANLIFSGIGLGLYGSMTYAGVYGIMLAVWLFQILFSVFWLSRFRFGPAEWVWRSLTYGKKQPLKQQHAG